MSIQLRTLRTLVLALLAVAAVYSAGFGQPKRMVPAERAERLKSELGLSDSQVAAVTRIYQESQQETQKAIENGGGDRQARMSVMRASMEKTDSRIDSLLTPDQKKKFSNAKKKHQGRMPGRSRGD